MKKELMESGIVPVVLIIVVLALVVSNIFFWVSLIKVSKAIPSSTSTPEEETKTTTQELRVYFTEEERQITELDTDQLCTKVCSERKYDGYFEGTLIKLGSSFKYECKCYMVVKAV